MNLTLPSLPSLPPLFSERIKDVRSEDANLELIDLGNRFKEINNCINAEEEAQKILTISTDIDSESNQDNQHNQDKLQLLWDLWNSNKRKNSLRIISANGNENYKNILSAQQWDTLEHCKNTLVKLQNTSRLSINEHNTLLSIKLLIRLRECNKLAQVATEFDLEDTVILDLITNYVLKRMFYKKGTFQYYESDMEAGSATNKPEVPSDKYAKLLSQSQWQALKTIKYEFTKIPPISRNSQIIIQLLAIDCIFLAKKLGSIDKVAIEMDLPKDTVSRYIYNIVLSNILKIST